MYKEEFEEIESCELVGNFNDEYVYDIEVNDDTHTFIANDMLVHNSLFVSFKPAMDHSNWKNLVINDELDWKENNFIILSKEEIKTDNSKCLGIATNVEDFKKLFTVTEIKDGI